MPSTEVTCRRWPRRSLSRAKFSTHGAARLAGADGGSGLVQGVLIEGKQHGATGYLVSLGEPLHNDVAGESAYIVLPATMTFDLQGRKVTQSGAVFTVALRKTADGWRVAAWAWAKGRR